MLQAWGTMFPKETTLTMSTTQGSSEMQVHLSTPFMQLSMAGHRDGSRMLTSGVLKKHGLNIQLPLTSELFVLSTWPRWSELASFAML